MKLFSIYLPLFLILVVESLFSVNSWQKFSLEIKYLSAKELVYIDNNFIHTYKNRQGLWLKVQNGDFLKKYSEKYGASSLEILELNNLPLTTIQFPKSDWLFIPYSKNYLLKLSEDNITRTSFVISKGNFIWPVEGSRITSRLGNRWGRYHAGLDIATGTGTMVVAAQSGIVKEVGSKGAFGLVIDIDNSWSYLTRYAHLSTILVKPGDLVRKGQIIAFSGNTGRSTGPHLHFEIRCMGFPLDPEKFLPRFQYPMEAVQKFEEGIKKSHTPKDS